MSSRKRVASGSWRRWFFIIACFGASIGLIVAVLASPPPIVGVVNPGSTRYLYESRLLNNPDRVEADFGMAINDKTGEIHTAYLNDMPDCEYRCMVATRVTGGYAVTLPSSYSYQMNSQGFDSPYSPHSIVLLTYWNGLEHHPETIKSFSGETLSLPNVLYQSTVSSVPMGKSMYTTPAYIRKDESGQIVVPDRRSVWYEPGGKYYGLVDMARITRTSHGFDVCLPKADTRPLIVESGVKGAPATIAHNC